MTARQFWPGHVSEYDVHYGVAYLDHPNGELEWAVWGVAFTSTDARRLLVGEPEGRSAVVKITHDKVELLEALND